MEAPRRLEEQASYISLTSSLTQAKDSKDESIAEFGSERLTMKMKESYMSSPRGNDHPATQSFLGFESGGEDHLTSPVASPALETPVNSDCNLFDAGFGKSLKPDCLMSSAPDNDAEYPPQSTWTPAWRQELDPRGFNFSGNALPLTQDNIVPTNEEEIPPTETFVEQQSSMNSPPPISPLPKPAWGVSNGRSKGSRSSKSERRSARRRPSHNEYQTDGKVSSTSSKSHGRGNTKAHISKSEPLRSGTSKDDSRAIHNLIERQYRNRLNNQFSSLLDAIPRELVVAEVGNGYGDAEREALDKRVNKGDVLMLAKRHIEALEKRGRELETQREVMLRDIDQYKKMWMRRDGQ
jgi:hypothetical protein